MDHYVAKAEDYKIEGPPTAYMLQELVETGRDDELLELMDNYEVTHPSAYVNIVES